MQQDLGFLWFRIGSQYVAKPLRLYGTGISKLQACTRLRQKYRWLSSEIYKIWRSQKWSEELELYLYTIPTISTIMQPFVLSPYHMEARNVSGIGEARVLGCMDAARWLATSLYVHHVRLIRGRQKRSFNRGNLHCVVCNGPTVIENYHSFCPKHKYTRFRIPNRIAEHFKVKMN